MTLIRLPLDGSGGQEVWLNPELIAAVEAVGGGDGCRVAIGGRSVHVALDLPELLAQLERVMTVVGGS